MIGSPKRRFLAAALAVASLGVAAGTAGADDASVAAKSNTTLSIQKEEGGFSGFARSSNRSCHSGRKVTLYRKSGKKSTKTGSDTAQPNQDGSQWSINVKKSGKYYASVKATKTCKGATSKTLSITL